jgi:hypothetical protein
MSINPTNPTDVPGYIHAKLLNAETLAGNKPTNLLDPLTDATHSLRAAALMNSVISQVQGVMHTPPEPTMREHEAEKALTKLVRELADALRGGWTMDDAKADADWLKLRALYMHYCGGVEDAFYEKTPALAAAVRKNDPHWFGQIALEAWNEYADAALVTRVEDEVRYLKSRDEALAEDRGR